MIPNDRLLQMGDAAVSLMDAFRSADEVLLNGVQGITDLITTPGLINVDFADVKGIMSGAGTALMGIGSARGDGRALKAAEIAINSPLLEASMEGAQGVLMSIAGGSDLGLFEINEAASLVQDAAHPEANIIFGTVIDDSLGDEVRVTVIAAGFDASGPSRKPVVGHRAGDRARQGGQGHLVAVRTGRRGQRSRAHQRRDGQHRRRDDDDDVDVPPVHAALTEHRRPGYWGCECSGSAGDHHPRRRRLGAAVRHLQSGRPRRRRPRRRRGQPEAACRRRSGWVHDERRLDEPGARRPRGAWSTVRSIGAVDDTDALVTTTPRLALAVVTADCVPVLMADARAGVVAAVHAGRVGRAERRRRPRRRGDGATRERTSRTSRCCSGRRSAAATTRCPPTMAAEVEAALPGSRTTTSRGTPGLDLRAGIARQLTDLGVTAIDVDPRCTVDDRNLFSHRRDAPTGRLASLVWME